MTHWELLIQDAVQRSMVMSVARRADAAAEKWANEFMEQPGIKTRIAELAEQFCQETIRQLGAESNHKKRAKKR